MTISLVSHPKKKKIVVVCLCIIHFWSHNATIFFLFLVANTRLYVTPNNDAHPIISLSKFSSPRANHIYWNLNLWSVWMEGGVEGSRVV